MTEEQVQGPQKAALVLMSLEEEVAVSLLRELDEEQVRRLIDSARGMPLETRQWMNDALKDFAEVLADDSPILPLDNTIHFREIAIRAFGEERAIPWFELPEEDPDPLDTIKKARVRAVAELLQEEHPQVGAVILSQLPEEQSAAILTELPEAMQSDLVIRISSIEELPKETIFTASEALAQALEAMGALSDDTDREQFDGVAFAASLLNELPKDDSDRILEALGEDASPRIREAMFTFEDLKQLDVRSIQALMREVSSEQIIVSLKTADEELRSRFLSAISKRAAQSMLEELEVMPPMRLSEVEAAQRSVVECAQRLGAEGVITLPVGGSGEELV